MRGLILIGPFQTAGDNKDIIHTEHIDEVRTNG